MKKLFTVFVIMLLALFQLKAQEWLVYDMDVLPEDTEDPFDWGALSDVHPGPDYYHYIMPDPVNPDNNLLRFGHPGESKTMYRWKMDAVPEDTSVTVLLRIKGDDVDFDRLCDVNIRNGKWREEIKINYSDGNVKIKNTGDGSVALFEGKVPGTVHGWHLYRIVMEVDTISVYIDENPEPVTKGICGRADDQTYVKFGDGSGDEVGSIVDWIAVDTSGAYAPGEGAAIPEGLMTNTEAHILLITPDERDDEQYEFLSRQGFTVEKFWPGALSEAGQDTIDMLNAADLIIVGRSPNSGDFDSPDKEVWNALTAPLIINSQWVARSNRINMFNSTSAYHMNDGPALAYGVVSDPADPIFDGVTLMEGDSVAWCYPPHDFLENADSATNGTILAAFNGTSPLVARWEAGVEYYPDAGDAPAGPRTYFGLGNDNLDFDHPNFFPLTKEARAVYVAEIYRMIGQDVLQPVLGAEDTRITFITPDERDDEQVEWLMNQGFDVTKFYPGSLSEAGQDTIDMLNATDLIIVGRSPNSGDFDSPDKEPWNALTAPLIINSQWVARSNRINMFNSTSAYHMNDGPPVAYGVVPDPADPIFDGVTLMEGDSMAWCYPPHDFLENADSATNGTILAAFNGTSPLATRWEAGVEYYPGAGDAPAGPRTYFGMGNDDAGWVNFFPLSREAKTVYLAEICRMTGIPVQEPEFGPTDHRITVITPDERDDPQVEWLMRQGFDVTKFDPGSLSEAGQDTIDMLNATDLIIVGRSPNSGDFDSPDKEVWNALTAPLIINSQWVARSNRINMFNSTSAYHMNDGPEVAYGVVSDPADPIFDEVTLMEGDSMAWCLPPHDFLENADSATNGTILAAFNETSPLVARWEAGVEYYPEAGDSPAGPRTYFGMGNDDAGWVNFFPLTREAKKVYLAEICRLIGLDEVPEVKFGAADYTVTFVSDDEEDDPQISWLMKNGIRVEEFYPGSALSEAGQDTIDKLNAADLIIVGRSPNSGEFDSPDKEVWNALTAPLILNTQWAARSNRINMFNSTSAYHMDDGPEIAYAVTDMEDDVIFSNVTLMEGDSVAWCLPPHDFLENADSANNGDIVAFFNETSPLLARWEAGVEYYPDAGDAPAGPRTYFGIGNDNVYASNFFPLTDEGQQVYLNEISRMLGAELSEVKTVSSDASLASLEYDVAEATLEPEFDPEVMEYTLALPEDVTEVNLTAIANSEDFISVEGDSTIDVSAGEPITTEVVVTAENGGKMFYAVTVYPFGTGIDEPEAMNDAALKLYPNPAYDQLYIESDMEISQVTIFNVIGKIVMDQSYMNNDRIELNISSLTPGVYMIRVDSGDQVSMEKFLKK